MKKFVFSLAPVYKYKQTIEKTQKAELAAARARLRALRDREDELLASFERCGETLARDLRERFDVPGSLLRHDAYFRRLRQEQDELKPKIATAERETERREQLLIATMRELKTYERLRDDQYRRHLKAQEAEETREIDEYVSYQTAT